jgi:hypothetical protein
VSEPFLDMIHTKKALPKTPVLSQGINILGASGQVSGETEIERFLQLRSGNLTIQKWTERSSHWDSTFCDRQISGPELQESFNLQLLHGLRCLKYIGAPTWEGSYNSSTLRGEGPTCIYLDSSGC